MSGLIGVLINGLYRCGTVEREECGIMKYINKYETEIKENINAVNPITGRTALHLALQGGFVNVANYLIKEGADINNVDKYGNTPIHYAVRDGNIEIVKMLIEAGAKVDIKNNENETIIQIASKHNHINIMELVNVNMQCMNSLI